MCVALGEVSTILSLQGWKNISMGGYYEDYLETCLTHTAQWFVHGRYSIYVR
jgi:hypothetical protein